MPDWRVGQLASRQERFCPYAAVNKYPYRHLYGEVARVVSDNFFASGAFRVRGWSLYYIRTMLDSSTKPLLLIPETEVEELFAEIRRTIDVQLTFPDVTKDPGFQLGFQEEGSPRPRYLGRLTSRYSILEIEEMIPMEGSAAEEPEDLDERTFPGFRRKMADAIASGKNKSRQARDRKKKDRIAIKKGWCAELKRAQCYLGLRPRRTAKPEDYHDNPNLSWEESQQAQSAYERAAGLLLPQLDLNAYAPYAFDHNVVFVCIDIEAYERDQTKVTEIGVCTLDTLDLVKVPPGESRQAWIKHMRCRHFRVVETSHLINTEFITGCAHRFGTKFGTSEWISIKEAPQVIATCFRPPFSCPGQYIPHPASMYDVPRNGSNIQPLIDDDPYHKRNIILLGHEVRSDVEYLRKIGYDVGNLSNVIEAIDTANLFRAYKHEQNPRKLGAVLDEFGIAGWHLHNAGNDAAYTTQALVFIALAAREPMNMPLHSSSQMKLAGITDEARSRLIEEREEWEAANEEDGDGGEAVTLLPAAETLERMEFERAMARGRKADERNEKKRARRDAGFRSARRSIRASGMGQTARGGSASQRNLESRSMPFDCEALDDIMGVIGGVRDGPYEDLIELSSKAEDVNHDDRTGGKDTQIYTPPSKHQTDNSTTEEPYFPPHLRLLRTPEKTKKTLTTNTEMSNAATPELSERMTRRLALLDD